MVGGLGVKHKFPLKGENVSVNMGKTGDKQLEESAGCNLILVRKVDNPAPCAWRDNGIS